MTGGQFVNTKGVIRIRKLKKNRQYNDQKKKDKRTNNYQQNITHKTIDRVTRPLYLFCVRAGKSLYDT
jgi:hypothetical protein